MSFVSASSIAVPNSSVSPNQAAEIIKEIERLRRTDPSAAALKAAQNIADVPPQLAFELLRGLMRTNRPHNKTAEQLAARAIQWGGMRRRTRTALASQARAKGLARTASILVGQTDN